MSQKCTCTPCQHCEDGTLWQLGGAISKHHPCDDLADLIPCDQCNGEGVDDYCDHCMDAYDIESEQPCSHLAN